MAGTIQVQQPEKREKKIAGKIYVINEFFAPQGVTVSEVYKQYVRQEVEKENS